MGAKACSRRDCDNIMCDRHSEQLGYICNDCMRDLELSKPLNLREIKFFMTTSKESMNHYKLNLDEIFTST